jgi:hypothetical protein
VIEVWQQLDVPGLELHHGDAVAWLEATPSPAPSSSTSIRPM